MEKYLPRILPSVVNDDIALVEEDGEKSQKKDQRTSAQAE